MILNDLECVPVTMQDRCICIPGVRMLFAFRRTCFFPDENSELVFLVSPGNMDKPWGKHVCAERTW